MRSSVAGVKISQEWLRVTSDDITEFYECKDDYGRTYYIEDLNNDPKKVAAVFRQ